MMWNLGDGGVGFQLSMYRLADAFEASSQHRRELNLSLYADRLAADNRQLVAYAERLERELKVRDEQLAAAKTTIADMQSRLDDQQNDALIRSLTQLDQIKERRQERDREKAARSQQT